MRPDNPGFWRQRIPIFGVSVALIVFVFIAVISFVSINQFQQRADAVEHTLNIIAKIEKIVSQTREAESGSRGFVIAGRSEFLESVDSSKRDLPTTFAALAALDLDASQKKNVEQLRSLVDARFVMLEKLIQLRHQDVDISSPAFQQAADEGLQVMASVRSHVALMQSTEKVLLSKRDAKFDASARLTKRLILFGTVTALLMIICVFWWLDKEIRQRRLAEQAVVDANQTLLMRTKQIEATNSELESFSYSISHDLRIPLRAIAGYARMVQEDYGSELDREGARLLEVICSNAKRMGLLIDDLLTFSKMGRQGVSAATLDMNAMVGFAMDELHRKDGESRATLSVGTLPAAWGDRALLYQVWMNLLSNAFKYSQTRADPQIKIEGRIEGGEIIYSVSDNGVGFDMQYYHKLFGVFQRLHAADEFPGTGVGLAIVQRIVTRHGGRVWAEAEVGRGAQFFFALPLKG